MTKSTFSFSSVLRYGCGFCSFSKPVPLRHYETPSYFTRFQILLRILQLDYAFLKIRNAISKFSKGTRFALVTLITVHSHSFVQNFKLQRSKTYFIRSNAKERAKRHCIGRVTRSMVASTWFCCASTNNHRYVRYVGQCKGRMLESYRSSGGKRCELL